MGRILPLRGDPEWNAEVARVLARLSRLHAEEGDVIRRAERLLAESDQRDRAS
jgi:hypothetical protein